MMTMSGMTVTTPMSGMSTGTPTTSSMSMSMSGMGMGMGMPMAPPGFTNADPVDTMMGMNDMAMVFFTGTTTPLFSIAWAPASMGQYAGTCIFLIVFAVIFRGLLAIRARSDDVLTFFRHRRRVSVSYTHPSGEKPSIVPWRASEAVILATLDVILAGVGYLLMIAVMTMNAGYFLSVLSGIFVGSMVFGRFVGNIGGH